MTVPFFVCLSRIDRVTVFARGARVTRRVEVPAALPSDATDLVVAGVTAQAEPGTARAFVGGEREVVGLRARRVVPRESGGPGVPIERLREREHVCRVLSREKTRCERARELLANAQLMPPDEPRFVRVDPLDRAQDAVAVVLLLDEELRELDARLRELTDQLEVASRELRAAQVDASQSPSPGTQGHAAPTWEFTIRLAPGASPPTFLEVDYVVSAARWWPAYTARLTSAGRALWDLEALVGQMTGEDWPSVALSLSTADLAQDSRLPELASLRLGRAQPPKRVGYRAPPGGLDALFEGFDRAAAAPAAASLGEDRARRVGPPPERPRQSAPPRDAEPKVKRRAGGPPSAGGAAPTQAFRTEMAVAPAPAPARSPQTLSRSRSAARPAPPDFDPGAKTMAMSLDAGRFDEGDYDDVTCAEAADGDEPEAPPAGPVEPTDQWLDFDALVMAVGVAAAGRGRLRAEPKSTHDLRGAAAAAIEALAPAGLCDPQTTRGHFDHTYDAAGAADVATSPVPQRIMVSRAETGTSMVFRTVPREVPEVFREVELSNPLDAPLLAGPVDVFLDGALLTTASIPVVDRGGLIRLGLGVEDRLRVARNVRSHEGSAGLLGGSTTVTHDVVIDLSSSLGHAVIVEVVDRVPVTDDRDAQVVETASHPPSRPYDQAERGAPVRGGRLWGQAVPPGGKARIDFSYCVTMPAKSELVGGNRRE